MTRRPRVTPPSSPAPDMKWCRRCQSHKPFGEFYSAPKHRDGLTIYCRVCSRAAVKASLAKRQAHPCPNHYYPSRLTSLGIALTDPHAEYRRVLAAQQGRCRICRTERPGAKRKNFIADFDPETQTIRALLCADCQQGLVAFQHKPWRLGRAVKYLKQTEDERRQDDDECS